MRKAPALLASALLLSTIAAGVGPMMAAAAAHAESPQPSIEVTERDEDDLDITVFSGVITNGRDYLNLSRGHNNIPSQPTPKSVVFGPSAAKVATLQTDSGVLAQKLVGGKSSVSILSASDILSANKNLINGGIDIARSSSSILSSVGSGSSIPSNSKPPIHSSTPKAPGGQRRCRRCSRSRWQGYPVHHQCPGGGKRNRFAGLCPTLICCTKELSRFRPGELSVLYNGGRETVSYGANRFLTDPK